MQEHRSRLWGIAVGLCFATAVGFACPVLANGDRNCGLESAATPEDAASAAQFRWPTYRLSDIGALMPLCTTAQGPRIPCPSYATAINNRGQVVGSFYWGEKAFIYEKGGIKEVPPLPGQLVATLYDINDSGVAVGVSSTDNIRGVDHSVIYWNGKLYRYLPSEVLRMA